jgi:hypothetical protein
LGEKFCISGGVSNVLLARGSVDDVRQHCKKIIDEVARDGGYIMDASAIVQNDAKIENIQAMTDFTREYGVYSSAAEPLPEHLLHGSAKRKTNLHPAMPKYSGPHPAGTCVPWPEERKRIPAIPGDETIVEKTWEHIDGLANIYLWQLLLSF